MREINALNSSDPARCGFRADELAARRSFFATFARAYKIPSDGKSSSFHPVLDAAIGLRVA